MSDAQTSIPQPNVRFGAWLSRGFQAFGEQWQNWVVQMLIAAGIVLAALSCLVLPVFLVLGPLSSGLHYCGLRAVRGQPVDGTALRRGWETAGRSMIAFIGLSFLHIFPALALYGLFMGAFVAMMASGAMVPPGARPMRPAGAPAIGIHVEDFTQVKRADANNEADPAAEPNAAKSIEERMAEDTNEALADALADGEDEQAGSSAAPAGGPASGQPGKFNRRELQFVGTMILFYGLMFVGGLLMLLWTVWFGMRTMYVMPLIADRGCSFSEALTESWRLTSTRFWELILTYSIAFIVGGAGANFCYVGLLATLPIYFTIIAAAYEFHALPQFTPVDDETPYGEPA